MKKKGISLILLVITIIIIIIIASAVILNLNNNNPVDKARLANVQSSRDSLKSGINLYIGKIMVKENGNHNASTMILGKNSTVIDYSIIHDYSMYEVVRGNLNIWQLDYTAIKDKVNLKLDIYDNNSRWYIDEYGNPYLVYNSMTNVSPYLKSEDNTEIHPQVKDFVVVLEGVEFGENTEPAVQEPEEDLTSSIAVTKNSNSTAIISGFSRNGIKSITYTGPRQGTITPTMNGNYYTAKAMAKYIGDGIQNIYEPKFTFYGFRSYIVSKRAFGCIKGIRNCTSRKI